MDPNTPLPSERNFGRGFSLPFLAIGLWPLLEGMAPHYWSLAASAALFLITFIRPTLLRVPNQLWHRFGLLLGGIVSPIVMAAVYLLGIVPTALVVKLFARDLLRLKIDRKAKSYWVERDSAIQSMKNQF